MPVRQRKTKRPRAAPSRGSTPAPAQPEGVKARPAKTRAPAPGAWHSSATVWALLAALLAAAVYSNTLGAALCFDDHKAVTGNADAMGQRPWVAAFWHDFWGQQIAREDSHKSWRPLTVLSFRADTLFAETTGVAADAVRHATNVALHATVSALVVFVAEDLLAGRAWATQAAGVAGALFAVHPIHAEAVAGIVGRAELLAMMLMLAGVLVLAGEGHRSWRWGAACTLATAATLCKETGIVALALFVAYDVCGRRDSVAALAARTGIAAATGAAYVAARISVAGTFGVHIYRHLENPIAFLEDTTAWALSNAWLHTNYASLLVAPVRMCADYSFNVIPLVEGWGDVRNLASAGAYAVLLGPPAVVAARVLATKPSAWLEELRARRLLVLVYAWGLLPFVPSANVLFPLGTMLAERLLYAPSLGLCLGLGYVVSRQLERRPASHVATAVVVVLSLASARLVMRNWDWASEEALFTQALRDCGASAKVHHNNGMLQRRLEDYAAAEKHFTRAQEIEPEYCEPSYYIGLGRINMLMNRRQAVISHADATAALDYIRKGIQCKYTAADSVKTFVQVQDVFVRDMVYAREELPALWAELGEYMIMADKPYEAQRLLLRSLSLERSSRALNRLAQVILQRSEVDSQDRALSCYSSPTPSTPRRRRRRTCSSRCSTTSSAPRATSTRRSAVPCGGCWPTCSCARAGSTTPSWPCRPGGRTRPWTPP